LRLSNGHSDEAKFRIAHTDDKTVNSLQESTNQPTNQPTTLDANNSVTLYYTIGDTNH
jgi:hypothetical protein